MEGVRGREGREGDKSIFDWLRSEFMKSEAFEKFLIISGREKVVPGLSDTVVGELNVCTKFHFFFFILKTLGHLLTSPQVFALST